LLYLAGTLAGVADIPVSHKIHPACPCTTAAGRKIGTYCIRFPVHAPVASRTTFTSGFTIRTQAGPLTKRAFPGGIIAGFGRLRRGGFESTDLNFIIRHLVLSLIYFIFIGFNY
jgi:hypothetical protein